MRLSVLLAMIVALALGGCDVPPSAGGASHHGSLSDILSLDMLNAKQGWTYGPDLVARTSDGARTFVDVTPPDVRSQQQVGGTFFLDSKRAWVWVEDKNGSAPATLETTSDGGATWQATGFRTNVDGGLTFVDSSHGWMLTGQGVADHTAVENTLWRTVDGGRSWPAVYRWTHKLTIQPNVQTGDCAMGEITWTSTSRGFAGVGCPFDSPPALAVTDDGGVTWTREPLPPLKTLAGVSLGESTGITRAFSMGPLIASVSRCVGPDGESCRQYGALYRSSDDGATWTQGAIVWGGVDIQMPDPDHGFLPDACLTDQCDSPELLTTSDGGATWQQLSLPRALWPNMHAERFYQFVTATVGFAVATSPGLASAAESAPATFYSTMDGGHTFSSFTPALV